MKKEKKKETCRRKGKEWRGKISVTDITAAV